jgi:amidase/aspartyl-tRNA(Asn)/glutamyl-tRNA(Gln) amidotransferase subunit A
VPLTLGSDTNGSIRVPAAFCGTFGLKATYGRISRAGTALFAESFDHVGPFTRSVQDLAVAFDVLNGPDPRDPICSDRPAESTLTGIERGVSDLRIAVAAGVAAEPRIYRPHVTLARTRKTVPLDALKRALTEIELSDIGHYTASSFSLYLSASGTYTKLEEFSIQS